MYCFWYVSRAYLLGSRSYVYSSKIFTLVLFPGRKSKARRFTGSETEASHLIGLDHRELLSVLPRASDPRTSLIYSWGACTPCLSYFKPHPRLTTTLFVLPSADMLYHSLIRRFTLAVSQDGGPLGLQRLRRSLRNKGLVVSAGFSGREYGPPNVRQDARQDHIF